MVNVSYFALSTLGRRKGSPSFALTSLSKGTIIRSFTNMFVVLLEMSRTRALPNKTFVSPSCDAFTMWSRVNLPPSLFIRMEKEMVRMTNITI